MMFSKLASSIFILSISLLFFSFSSSAENSTFKKEGLKAYQAGEYKIAQVLLDRASQETPLDWEIWLYLGKIYYAEKDLQQTIGALENALSLAAGNEGIKEFLLKVREKQKQAEILYEIGVKYRKSREFNEAGASFAGASLLDSKYQKDYEEIIQDRNYTLNKAPKKEPKQKMASKPESLGDNDLLAQPKAEEGKESEPEKEKVSFAFCQCPNDLNVYLKESYGTITGYISFTDAEKLFCWTTGEVQIDIRNGTYLFSKTLEQANFKELALPTGQNIYAAVVNLNFSEITGSQEENETPDMHGTFYVECTWQPPSEDIYCSELSTITSISLP